MPIRARAGRKRLSQEHLTLIANRARALGEPTRVRIVEVISRGEQPVGQIAEALGTQQSTVSKHLQVLYHAGLVHRRRAASTVIYSLAAPDVLRWCHFLRQRHLNGGRKPSKT